MKYFGWILYPSDKQGKEEKNRIIRESYGKHETTNRL